MQFAVELCFCLMIVLVSPHGCQETLKTGLDVNWCSAVFLSLQAACNNGCAVHLAASTQFYVSSVTDDNLSQNIQMQPQICLLRTQSDKSSFENSFSIVLFHLYRWLQTFENCKSTD